MLVAVNNVTQQPDIYDGNMNATSSAVRTFESVLFDLFAKSIDSNRSIVMKNRKFNSVCSYSLLNQGPCLISDRKLNII